MDSPINGSSVHQQPHITTEIVSTSNPIVSAPSSLANIAARHNSATRLINRVPTPYPDVSDGVVTDLSTSPFHLAEAAANASMQLQQQINLMAQAMGMQPSVNTSSTAVAFQPIVASSSSPPQHPSATTSLPVLTSMFDQYFSAAAAASAIQQQQVAVSVLNQQTAAPPADLSSVANFPNTPLTTYLQSQNVQQPSGIASIQLLPQHQQQPINLPIPMRQPTSNLNNVYNSLLSATSTLCPCGGSPINNTSSTVTCPYHLQPQHNDGNNNSVASTATIELPASGTMGEVDSAQLLLQQQIDALHSNSSNAVQPQRQSGGIIQHQSSSATGPVNAATQSNRVARSSLKRSSAAASLNLTASPSNNEDRNTNAMHISSPPPELILSNATSIRLSSRQQGVLDGGGPSRGQKLRRLASLDELADAASLTEQITTATDEFRAPSVTNVSATTVANAATAAAIVQLQQQAVAAAALPSAATIMSLAAASVAPTSTATNSNQQQQRVLQHFNSSMSGNVLNAPPPVAPFTDQNSQATLAALAPSATAASISAGVEQIVAAALSAASAANAAMTPQTIAAMAAATGYPQSAPTQCAVCAAAACQSRMGTPMASAVTACSCLHHHHHHLHCHHNAIVPAPPTFPVCTLCNSNVVGGSSSTPSPTTTSIAQPHQLQQHTSNATQLHQYPSNISGTAGASNSSNGARSIGAVGSLQQTAPIAQHYLLNPTPAMSSSAVPDGNNNARFGDLTNSVNANLNIQANISGGSTSASAATFSPSAVTAMLLNSAAAMSSQQPVSQLVQPASTTHQSMPSLYGFQRNSPIGGDFNLSQTSHMSSMQQNLLASRLAQQERERDAANNFYQQQQHRAAMNAAAAAAAAAAVSQSHHLMRPLIMVPRLHAQMDLANLVLLHHPGTADAATLVLNGGANAASALAHATNPHHIVANAMATAAAPEPQPVGVSLEQIKKHSQKLAYVKDPDVPEQERERCTVCLSDFETGDELRALNCAHLFHTECIDRWLQYNKKCPVCRVDMDKGGAGSSAAAAEAAVMLNAYAAAAAAASATSSTAC